MNVSCIPGTYLDNENLKKNKQGTLPEFIKEKPVYIEQKISWRLWVNRLIFEIREKYSVF